MLEKKKMMTNNLLSGFGGEKEFEIDGERSLLDGGSEIPARLQGVVGVEGGESVEGSKQIWRVRPRFQNLLQLPRQPWSERNRHRFSILQLLLLLPPPLRFSNCVWLLLLSVSTGISDVWTRGKWRR